jgi:hypothetical protein
MLERILTKQFRDSLKATFKDIQQQQHIRDEKEFAKDEQRIKEQLLDTVDTFPQDVVFDEDFLVGAVDGSGNDGLALLDDVRVHLFSTACVILSTNTQSSEPFTPLDDTRIEECLGSSQPHLETFWYAGVKDDARRKMAEYIDYISSVSDPLEIVMPFFRDFTRGEIDSWNDLKDSKYAKYLSRLESIQNLISRVNLTNSTIHDQLRTISEYAAARKILDSSIRPKYLLLDGAMSVFIHHIRNYPSMPSGFLLREMCTRARKEGVILCAVSKTHTIPFAHRIAQMAADVFGETSKWFCQLPGSEDPGGGLHITQSRTYIPPMLAVPYLFSFSRDNRPSRIDFDRIWWLENIFVENDPIATRENEKALFRELEYMSRDARWYGYPVPLAVAHEQCKISYQDIRLAREICWDVRQEMGMDERRMEPQRTDFNL